MKRHGHARVNPRSPRAFATCDRCSRLFNHVDLRWQEEWRGRSLQNLRLLVCDDCLDVPQEQLRVIVLPPDPLPILNARPELADMGATTVIRGLQLAGESGSYGLTGSPATLRVTYKIALASGAYGLSGDASALDYYPPTGTGSAFSSGFSSGFGISLVPYVAGTYGLTGSSATLRLTRPLSLASGAYGLTGHTGTLTLTLGGTGTVAGATGTFALSGHALTPLTTRKLPEATGSFALTGSTATLIRKYVLSGNSGAYALSGSAGTVKLIKTLAAATGSFALTGSAAVLANATWNPSGKSSALTLSGGNLIATLPSALSGGDTAAVVRATLPATAGRAFETQWTSLGAGAPYPPAIGLILSGTSLTQTNSAGTGGISYQRNGIIKGPSGDVNTGVTYFMETMTVYVDATTVKFYKAGTLVGTYSHSLTLSNLYPAAWLETVTDVSDQITAAFGNLSFLPGGATAWNS